MKRQTGNIIWFNNLLIWSWVRMETKARSLGRMDHLIVDLVCDYNASQNNGERTQINSAEQLYQICKEYADKEKISVASFIEKICSEEMERSNGLKLSRTVESHMPNQDKKTPWYVLPKAEGKK